MNDDTGYYWSCRICGLNCRSPDDYPKEAGTFSGHGFEWSTAALGASR